MEGRTKHTPNLDEVVAGGIIINFGCIKSNRIVVLDELGTIAASAIELHRNAVNTV